ncbi:MAG TPA: hypothetical protein V6C57_15860 [Coleofasciculaceae cyanobacterium]
MTASRFNKSGFLIASMFLLSAAACTSQTSNALLPEQSALAPSPNPSASSSPFPASLRSATLSPQGFGAIQVGMTVEAAAQAAGMPLIALDGSAPHIHESCSYVKLQDGLEGLDFMLKGDRIVRVDVRSHVIREIKGQPMEVDLTNKVSQVTTQSGAKVGDTEAQIQALYPGQVQVSNHKYVTGGHYLTVAPANSNSRLIFETNGDRVTSIRAGQLPEVEWVERCG